MQDLLHAHPDQFHSRHNGPTPEETQEMLKLLGISDLNELVTTTVPSAILHGEGLDVGEAMTERQLQQHMQALAAKNKVYKSYIGQGYYGTIVPAVIQRNVLENPSWYTQYTPYQAEIAQGRLEALLNFQTMVSDLTGLELANASLLDEATAAAEAMTLMFDRTRKKKRGDVFLVDHKLHPQSIEVLQTRAEPMGIELEITDLYNVSFEDKHFGLIVQYPNTEGAYRDHTELVASAHANDMLAAFSADILSLMLLKSPGEMGADVVVGSTQRFGVPMGYGGPHAAYFATRDEFKRQVPGRLVGVTKDAEGRTALRLALQTREQHIKRERATSNICTAQVLLAIMSGFYAVYHGPKRLKQIAQRVNLLTKVLHDALADNGVEFVNENYFDTLTFKVQETQALRERALKAETNLRYVTDEQVGVSVDETTSLADIQALATLILPEAKFDWDKLTKDAQLSISDADLRADEVLTHEVFNSYHSETEMMRYIKRLEKRDLSLTHSMIPLGSCTMKLNAAVELQPLSYEGFNGLHPFIPDNQAEGYHEMIEELREMLCKITGFAGMSFMPNSGAQGEYAGLMVIREYLRQKGDGHRNIALIPSSAHGTNPASAVMAGMKVVVVKCDENGNIDVDDLTAKAEKHSENLAALMITYPSTHGVFEEAIKDINALIHKHGGQVYMDGANLNAQVGLTTPGFLGADVCHLNLHKTFCIPHGGGGPGMGPIGVAEHLVPHLPGHRMRGSDSEKAMGAVAAAPFSSASILTISYAYIKMLGGEALTEATKYAILNANYIRKRLEGHYDVLFTGQNGFVAHELILDLREFKQSAGIEVDDLGKRLIDYGFHAPTVSWPVAGTVMIEPTESESKYELDRFCDALIGIRAEIQEVVDGKADQENNVLKNAPHTIERLMTDDYTLPYSREKASNPQPQYAQNKFWPHVARVDNSYGDRNLMCTCPPLEEYTDEELTPA